MLTSTAWINDYLDPPATAEQQGDLLTRAGFPLEGSETVAVSTGSDTRQDFEMTSNRGDCVCHLGLAREIAALSSRALKIPAATFRPSGPPAASLVRVTNTEPQLCPLYTARIICGVKIGPSPPWLRDRLTARGDIPRNNLVDLTNFVLFEFGQPTHVFDMAKLLPGTDGPEIIIRRAHGGEPFLPIGEGAVEVKLTSDDLVIADGQRAAAIAGVKGGALTAVTDATTDILIEGATFSPVTVRNTSRRLNIASDSSYRYERGVHPAMIEPAVDRLVSLILELCGGELCEGIVADGQPIPPLRTVSMRCDRCRQLLGVDISDKAMAAALARLGFEVQRTDGSIHCTVPPHRLDIEREVDLIEEVSRMFGHDNIPIADTLHIRVAPPQSTVMARRAVNDALVGMGYLETTTHSLISDAAAEPFLPEGTRVLCVDEARAAAEPALRPSLVPSLLRVYSHNRDSGSPDVSLFETGATFLQRGGEAIEQVNLALLRPGRDRDRETTLRELRGALDRLVQIVLGPDVTLHVEPATGVPWFEAAGSLRIQDRALGTFGLLASSVVSRFGLSDAVFAAELALPELYDRYPPETEARPLPSFPAIERDVSAVLDEAVTWLEVRSAVEDLNLSHLEAIQFITTFRGKPVPSGRKSLSLRLRFREVSRTLTHADVDPQMQAVVQKLQQAFGAEIRTAAGA